MNGTWVLSVIAAYSVFSIFIIINVSSCVTQSTQRLTNGNETKYFVIDHRDPWIISLAVAFIQTSATKATDKVNILSINYKRRKKIRHFHEFFLSCLAECLAFLRNRIIASANRIAFGNLFHMQKSTLPMHAQCRQWRRYSSHILLCGNKILRSIFILVFLYCTKVNRSRQQ